MKTLIFLMICVIVAAHGGKKHERCRPVPNVKVLEGPRFQLLSDLSGLKEKVEAFKAELSENEEAANCLKERNGSDDTPETLETYLDETIENKEILSDDELRAALEVYGGHYQYLSSMFSGCLWEIENPRGTVKNKLEGLQNKLRQMPVSINERIEANPDQEECLRPVLSSVKTPTLQVDYALENFNDIETEVLQAAFNEAYEAYGAIHEELAKCQEPAETEPPSEGP